MTVIYLNDFLKNKLPRFQQLKAMEKLVKFTKICFLLNFNDAIKHF